MNPILNRTVCFYLVIESKHFIMRNSIIIVLLLFGVGGTALVLTSNQGIKEKIIDYFETGNVEGLSTLLSEDVILTLYDKEEFENKNAVNKKVKAFFEQYPPESFKVRHYGKSIRKNCFYMVGVLQTTQEVFRVTIMIDNEKIEDININFEHPISSLTE